MVRYPPKKKEQKKFNTPSSTWSPLRPPLPGLQPHPPCPSLPWQNHPATRLPAQRLLLSLPLIHNFSDRQIRETPDEVPTAGQWTVVVSRTDLLGPFRHEQTHFRPLLPDIRPSCPHPLLPTVNKGTFLYSNMLTTLTLFACIMNTTSILRSISPGLAHSHVPDQFGVRRRYRG